VLPRKRAPDIIHSTSADLSVGLYPVSLPRQPLKKWRQSQSSVDGLLLDLPDPYHWHAIATFNTCSRGPTHRSLTDTGRGYNLLRAPSGFRLSNLNIASEENMSYILLSTHGLSTTRRLPKSISTPSNC
jgi:hypothetical protein